MKILIWLVIAAAVVVWIQRAKKSLTTMSGENGPGGAQGGRGPFRRQAKAQPETMVQCAHCNIHFPVSEAVTNSAGLVFCSEEHLRLASH